MANIFDKLFNVEKKRLQEIENKVKPVEALSQTYRDMSDEQLKAKTVEFKERLANGETLDDIFVEPFATIREAAYRVIKEYPYFVQLMGAAVMY